GRFGGHFEARRESLATREQRMVAAHLKLLGHAFENSQTAMTDRGRLSVHRIIQNAQLAAERLDDPLQAETHAEDRHTHADGGLHHLRYTEVCGTPRAR